MKTEFCKITKGEFFYSATGKTLWQKATKKFAQGISGRSLGLYRHFLKNACVRRANVRLITKGE